MQKERITFKPSVLSFQKQNGVPRRTTKTIIDIIRAVILEGNIVDDLWPEFILIMTCVKKNQLTKPVQNFSSYIIYIHKLFNLFHFQVLGCTVYVSLYKEEQN